MDELQRQDASPSTREDFHASRSRDPKSPVEGGANLSAPSELFLDELDEADLAPAQSLEDATMSIRPQVLGDTSIPVQGLAHGTANALDTIASLNSEPIDMATVARISADSITPPSIMVPNRTGDESLDESIPIASYATPGPDSNPLGFIIEQQVGVGGYGEVYSATQVGLGRTIAVKRLKSENVEIAKKDAQTAKWMEYLFQQEAITTALLEHPNIVPIHNYVTDAEGRPNLTMKLVRGSSWDKIIESELGAIPHTDFLTKHLGILIDVSQAVGYAHAHGIVHRDLKPQQVMVGEFGEVILMDWGLALVYEEALLPSSIRDTPIADVLARPHDAPSPGGSPAFMAPEQTARTAVQVGPWTDIFMLGGILYAILTGTPPHRRSPGQKAGVVFKLAAECQIEPPELRAPDIRIPPELANLAMDCLRREPAMRVPSVQEFISRIQDYLTGATRRRESRALTDQVALELNDAEGDYRKLSDCDSRLDQALFLWPDNPDGLSLREQVLQLYTEAAMANEDLALARVQAERLPAHHDARNELLMEISVLENLASRETFEAREAELARRKADSRRRRTEEVLTQAEQNRIAAIEARAFAESLLEHLVGDVIASLPPPNPNAPTVPQSLVAAAGRVATYFDATDASDITDRMIVQRARTCDALAHHLTAHGETVESARMGKMAQLYMQALQQRESSRHHRKSG